MLAFPPPALPCQTGATERSTLAPPGRQAAPKRYTSGAAAASDRQVGGAGLHQSEPNKGNERFTFEEHQQIIAAEVNPERKALYQLCWHLGGSQGDIANLKGEDVDWAERHGEFYEKKDGRARHCPLGSGGIEPVQRPARRRRVVSDPSRVRANDRATEFRSRCRQLGISGVTLHSYRYAWAERAKTVGYPERFAQEALGHNSKAVHRAYAKRALMKIPSLEEYEATSKTA